MCMNEKVKRRLEIILFWIAAIVPFVAIFMLGGVYGSYGFVVSLSIYAVIYRPLLHIVRLLSLKVIDKRNAWKLFIPFYQTRYLKALWFG